MQAKILRSALFIFFLFIAACQQSEPQQATAQEVVDISTMTEQELTAYAMAVHERVLTLDTHDDIPFNYATDEVDPGVRGSMQVDLPKMREGLLDVGTFIVYVGQTPRTEANYEKAKSDAMIKFNAIHRMAEMYPDEIEVAYTPADVLRIHESGKLVAAIAIENGYVIGKDLSLIQKYRDLGANYITLAHGGHNDIADSSTPRPQFGDGEEEHGGISAFGRQVIDEMNRVGIMVDVSHISKKASIQASEYSKVPVIASHSSVNALCPVARNMDDEQLKAVQASGGVVNMVALGSFVKVSPVERIAAINGLRQRLNLMDRNRVRTMSDEQRQEWDAGMAEIDAQWPGPNVSDFVDHIDYAVELIGIDHVGISSDFDGGGGVIGWEDASETANVTLELVRRGYSEDEIEKLWSGNYLRVWQQAQDYAASMQ